MEIKRRERRKIKRSDLRHGCDDGDSPSRPAAFWGNRHRPRRPDRYRRAPSPHCCPPRGGGGVCRTRPVPSVGRRTPLPVNGEGQGQGLQPSSAGRPRAGNRRHPAGQGPRPAGLCPGPLCGPRGRRAGAGSGPAGSVQRPVSGRPPSLHPRAPTPASAAPAVTCAAGGRGDPGGHGGPGSAARSRGSMAAPPRPVSPPMAAAARPVTNRRSDPSRRPPIGRRPARTTGAA